MQKIFIEDFFPAYRYIIVKHNINENILFYKNIFDKINFMLFFYCFFVLVFYQIMQFFHKK